MQASTRTVQDCWYTEKAGYAGADQPHKSGPSPSDWSLVHHQYGDDVGGDFQRSRQERVEVDVSVKCSSVERQCIVDEATRCPAMQLSIFRLTLR